MATLKEFVTRFGFEVDDKGLKELEEGIEGVKEGLLHLGEILIGEAVGLYELVQHAAEAGVQLKIMTQQTGIAAEKLQELQFRAKLADVSAEELNQSMTLLSRSMQGAREGSEEAKKHFRLLGITTAELKSSTMTTDKIIEKVAARFEKMPDGPKKTALALDLFGRSGARMVPFLNALHHELDPVNKKIFEMSVITEDQIEQSEHWHIQMETLKTAIVGMARIVGFGLLPVATEVVNTMKRWIVENKEMIKTDLTEFVQGMANALKLTLAIANALVKSFSGLAHSIGGVKIATELLLGTLAVLAGLSVLIGLGKIITAVQLLGTSLKIAKVEAILVQAAMGAALIAIFLICEDIASFFSGKDSFLGDLLNLLPEVGAAFRAMFDPIFDPFINLINMVTNGVGSWKDIFLQLGVIIVNTLLLPMRQVAAGFGGLVSLIGRISGSSAIQDFGKDVTKYASNIRLAGVTPEAATGITATDSVASRRGGGPTTKNDIESTQIFNFPPGTDPAVVGDKISSSVSDGLDDVLRKTQRAGSNGGAY